MAGIGVAVPLFHVWFATKGRRWLLQEEVLDSVKQLFAEIATDKQIELIEYEGVVDHVHILLRAANKQALVRAINDLKGISSRRVFQQYPELKLDAHTNTFWQARYNAKIVPEEAEANVRSYIRTQWDRLEDYAR